jgi:hypothetical protein
MKDQVACTLDFQENIKTVTIIDIVPRAEEVCNRITAVDLSIEAWKRAIAKNINSIQCILYQVTGRSSESNYEDHSIRTVSSVFQNVASRSYPI